MVGDEVDEAVNAAVECAAVRAIGRAEVHAAGMFTVACHVQRVLGKLADALILRGGDGHHRDAERRLERVHINRAAVFRKLIHHVEREHHRAVELHELEREVEVALDVRGIHDVDNRVRLLFQDELAAHDLFARVGRKRVNAGQVP